MLRSRLFWKLFCIYGLALLLLVAILSVVLSGRNQRAELPQAIWMTALFAVVTGTVLAFWLGKRLIEPIQDLTQHAQRIAAGDLGGKVYVSSRDEMAVLARTFNDMKECLAEQFAELENDRQQLRTILFGMQEGVIALDGEERILFANQRAAVLLGFQTQSAVGRKLWEIVRQRTIYDMVRRVLGGEAACQGEMETEAPEARFLLIRGVRLPGPGIRGAVLVLHDATELRRLERVRQEFVANVSHELKTPLAVIKACVETLADGAVEDEKNRGGFLQQIAEQADHLHALILDLLSLARIESGSASFEFEPVYLDPLVAECVERHSSRAVGKQQTLEIGSAVNGVAQKGSPRLDALPANPPVAWADQEAVSQILENLVDNAVKYTPEGGNIWVRYRGDGDQVVLEVEDTGIGIPERDLPRIFERFYRADKARSRELGGTGLGLSIVKHLVQSMHGSIRASSRLGKGTTFEVRLPRAPA
jgi:two-component system phosphate regulon sensor histidine kinase PhoR